MADIPNNIPKPNGMWGLLTSLASSGDNQVKLVIVLLLGLNTLMNKCNNTGIKDNGAELDKLRQQVAKQVSVIHRNQKTYVDGINDARSNHRAIMDKLGIAHPDFTPYPQAEPQEEQE